MMESFHSNRMVTKTEIIGKIGLERKVNCLVAISFEISFRHSREANNIQLKSRVSGEKNLSVDL